MGWDGMGWDDEESFVLLHWDVAEVFGFWWSSLPRLPGAYAMSLIA
jgi:hypothetical protein